MPGGSDYSGPKIAFGRYREVVEASSADTGSKGAKNPCTSRNGHMFGFLDGDGTMALSLSVELRDEFRTSHPTDPVMQNGSVMRRYVAIPVELFDDIEQLTSWFDPSYEWVGTLEPK